MDKWECPECGKTNSGSLIICACGYHNDGWVYKNDVLSMSTSTIEHFVLCSSTCNYRATANMSGARNVPRSPYVINTSFSGRL